MQTYILFELLAHHAIYAIALLFLVCDFAECKVFPEHVYHIIAGSYLKEEEADVCRSQVTFTEPRVCVWEVHGLDFSQVLVSAL